MLTNGVISYWPLFLRGCRLSNLYLALHDILVCARLRIYRLVSVVGSPSLPDKAKHNREVMILLPQRERANNSMYYTLAENGQVPWESNRIFLLQSHMIQ